MMDERIIGTFSLHSIRNVTKSFIELEEALKKDGDVAPERQRETITQLAMGTRLLIEGRNEGYLNNIRMLQLMKFLNDQGVSAALRMYDRPDPERDFGELVKLAKTFAERLPKFKEDVCC
jgi:hypothetical protein